MKVLKFIYKNTFYAPNLAIIFLATILISFQSCSPAEYTFHNKYGSSLENGPNLDDLDLIAKACADARTNGHLRKESFPISLPNPATEVGSVNTCGWERNGNGEQKGAHLMARHEQVRLMPLPEGAILCDLDMDFPTQKFSYDDHFFLSLNGFVIATDASYALNRMDQVVFTPLGRSEEISLHMYSWPSIFGLKWPFDPRNSRHNFCLGEDIGIGNCQWPASQQAGTIEMAFSKELIQPIGLLSNKNSLHEVRFTVTGDNDNEVDCKHEPIEFTIKASFITP